MLLAVHEAAVIGGGLLGLEAAKATLAFVTYLVFLVWRGFHGDEGGPKLEPHHKGFGHCAGCLRP
eukprot:3625485-Amphidinium_carterae.1